MADLLDKIKEAISIHALREEGDTLSRCHLQKLSCISIHALREEGDYPCCQSFSWLSSFLSTPSARRATRSGCGHRGHCHISIHALREEGDQPPHLIMDALKNFYPRPPRGGRRKTFRTAGGAAGFLSTPSARRATLTAQKERLAEVISIHALREEGDQLESYIQSPAVEEFLSTPSARRATRAERGEGLYIEDFYPRPPRGGRQPSVDNFPGRRVISIHALREEGDAGHRGGRRRVGISIHALREEGDRLPQQGRQARGPFLSTPSARRATRPIPRYFDKKYISIHALREEGDPDSSTIIKERRRHFYPRPPRGGRLQHSRPHRPSLRFLSTPSARRATTLF